MKRLYTIAFLFLILFSCEKEKNEVKEDYQSSSLIRQIGQTEDFMQIFTYYNTGNIYEYLQRFSYRKYVYNENNLLEKIEIAQSFNPLSCAIIPGTTYADGDDPRKAPIGQSILFEYNNDHKLSRKSHYFIIDENLELMNYEEFVYENNLVFRTNFYNIQNELTQFRTFEYDNNENVVIEEHYYIANDTNSTLNSHISYEYDDKHNPFKVFAVEGLPGRNTNTNNITKETARYYYNGEEDLYTTIFLYEYNELGYPILVNDVEYIYGKDE